MVLRSADTEMNISQFGAKERKTRIGYKDKQKRDAFMQMQHIGRLNFFSLAESLSFAITFLELQTPFGVAHR